MKKMRWISLILSFVMVFALAACNTAKTPAGSETPAPTQAPAETNAPRPETQPETEPEAEPEAEPEPEADPEAGTSTEEDGQNPVMNFIGTYACGRAGMEVQAEGMDGARILVHWGSSAWESANWEMSGRLDPDTLVLTYADCKKTIVTFAEDGESSTETVEYENGTGTITFNGTDYSLTWQDDQENAAEGMVFTSSYAASEDADAYAVATSFDKAVVEGFAADVRQTVLDENWEALAPMIAYPMTASDGTELKTPEEFTAHMAGRTLDEETRASFEAETCEDLFANYQGVSMADGRLWFAEVILEEGSLLKIISFSAV